MPAAAAPDRRRTPACQRTSRGDIVAAIVELPAEPLEVQLVGVARQHESRAATPFPDDHFFDGGIRREDVAPGVGDRLVRRLQLKIASQAFDERRRAQPPAVVVLFE